MKSDGETSVLPDQVVRKPWSAPRVISSELRSTHHQVGVTASDKTNFTTDHHTASGSQGS